MYDGRLAHARKACDTHSDGAPFARRFERVLEREELGFTPDEPHGLGDVPQPRLAGAIARRDSKAPQNVVGCRPHVRRWRKERHAQCIQVGGIPATQAAGSKGRSLIFCVSTSIALPVNGGLPVMAS